MSTNRSQDLTDPTSQESPLPEIEADHTFRFQCGSQMPCFNRCCRDLTLPLTPYDLLRLRYQLGQPSQDILLTFTTIHSIPETGLPMPLLRMIESPDRECPFSLPAGCSVYDDRPGACRAYPLGRGAKITRSGIETKYYMVNENTCKGFGNGQSFTPASWLENNGMTKYNYFNDKYMQLNAKIQASGQPVAQKLAGMALVSLYQIEEFRALIQRMKIFSHLQMEKTQQDLIMSEGLDGDEACLEFGHDWLELIIFGTSILKPRDNGIG